MKQMQMYICTLWRIYSRRVLDALLYKLELRYWMEIVAISVENDTFSRIQEFKQASILASDNTNYKNDLQHFSQLFDEHQVNGDYH